VATNTDGLLHQVVQILGDRGRQACKHDTPQTCKTHPPTTQHPREIRPCGARDATTKLHHPGCWPTRRGHCGLCHSGETQRAGQGGPRSGATPRPPPHIHTHHTRSAGTWRADKLRDAVPNGGGAIRREDAQNQRPIASPFCFVSPRHHEKDTRPAVSRAITPPTTTSNAAHSVRGKPHSKPPCTTGSNAGRTAVQAAKDILDRVTHGSACRRTEGARERPHDSYATRHRATQHVALATKNIPLHPPFSAMPSKTRTTFSHETVAANRNIPALLRMRKILTPVTVAT
jgi:hypothetical protein